MNPIEITGFEELQEVLIEASHIQPVVAVVWSSTCVPCRALKPKLEELSREFGFPLARLQADANRQLVASLGVRAVPTTIVYARGVEVGRLVGDMKMVDLKKELMKVGAFQLPLL